MSVSVVIPVYKPNKEVLNKIEFMLKKQTVKNELIKVFDKAEAESMNEGLKKAKNEIVVTLSQDCIPENEYWLENLIKPFKDKDVVATVSDTVVVPLDLWKRLDIVAKVLMLKEQKTVRSLFDARGCAYRKKILEKVGYFKETTNFIGIDYDIYLKLKMYGKVEYPGTKIYHNHSFTGNERLLMEYKYAKGSGIVTKVYGLAHFSFWKRVIKAIPFLGIIGTIYVFPIRRSFPLFLIYLLLSPILHIIYLIGFWRGFIFFKNK